VLAAKVSWWMVKLMLLEWFWEEVGPALYTTSSCCCWPVWWIAAFDVGVLVEIGGVLKEENEGALLSYLGHKVR
jgi:hypothetical protein